MPSYRFCRPDDIPYLVRAVNECWDVRFPDAQPMTVERYRDEMKYLDVWPSNCLVASTDDGPVAVLIGTKRPTEVSILRVGVCPGHERQGHGEHLLTSLSHKLAVLGPERLVAEVPRALDALEFFAAAGYRPEATYTDYLRPDAPADPVPEGLVIPITVDELDDHGLLQIAGGVAWERRRETLVNRKKDEIEGIAIVSPECVEAFLLHRIADDASSVDVVAAGARDAEQQELFFGLLLRHLVGETALPLQFPRLLDGEFPESVLRVWSFEAGETYDLVSAEATPA